MGSLSDYSENELLDHVLKVGAYTQPTNIYVALSTADPLDTGAGISEPVGNGYARKVHNAWDAAAARLTENTGVVTFAQATGSWGTITHYALFDAITAGNMLAHGSLTTSKAIVSGNTPSIADGEIDISFNAGAISNYLANALLDHMFKNTAYTVPTNLYVALSTATITDSDTGTTITEPSGNAYARKVYNTWDTAAAGASANSSAITFATPTGSWGLITYSALIDALTLGNMLLYGTATPNQTPDNGDTVEYPTGDYDVAMT